MTSGLKTQKALVVFDKPGSLAITTSKCYPSITPNEIVVEIKAVALNPTDRWHVDNLLKTSSSTGSDFAGVIVEMGSAPINKDLKVGDAVAGFIRGGFKDGVEDLGNGAFSEYIRIRSELVWLKPESLSYEDAAAMGIAFTTAAWVLYSYLGLPKPWATPVAAATKSAPILIWAGSSSVGLDAIHLAKLAGYPVVTTASPHNHALLKSLGADAMFDYKDPDVSEKIMEWCETEGYGRDGISIVLDTISTAGSTMLAAKALGASGGRIITLLPSNPKDKYPENVSVQDIGIYMVLEENNIDAFADIQELYKALPALVSKGVVRNAIPLTISDGGLEEIPEGIDLLRQKKLSATKLVYRI